MARTDAERLEKLRDIRDALEDQLEAVESGDEVESFEAEGVRFDLVSLSERYDRVCAQIDALERKINRASGPSHVVGRFQ